MSRVSHAIDRVRVSFDDPNLVANAGLLLVATLAVRLELERLVNAKVPPGGRVGGARPGRKVLTLVHAIVAGASHIDHADVLRSGGTQRVLPFRVMAPSTLGTFLRAFTFGHVRQLEAVVGEALRRAWALGAGPGSARLVIDVDSTVCEVAGKAKQGAAFGYTKVLGYHPILATRADTGEVLPRPHAQGLGQHRPGCPALHRRAGGPTAPGRGQRRDRDALRLGVLVQGHHRHPGAPRRPLHDGGAHQHPGIAAAIAAIDPDAWVDIDYTPDGLAQVAECTYKGRRLIVRRTRLTGAAQRRLWPDWRHFGFLTDLDGDVADVDAFHRDHAVVELAIRDLKEGAGMEHVPSGDFSANSAWLQCAVLAHNLIRWTATLGQPGPVDRLTVARTVRIRLIAVPGRLVNRAGINTLRGPAGWPWAAWFTGRLQRLRALRTCSGLTSCPRPGAPPRDQR